MWPSQAGPHGARNQATTKAKPCLQMACLPNKTLQTDKAQARHCHRRHALELWQSIMYLLHPIILYSTYANLPLGCFQWGFHCADCSNCFQKIGSCKGPLDKASAQALRSPATWLRRRATPFCWQSRAQACNTPARPGRIDTFLVNAPTVPWLSDHWRSMTEPAQAAVLARLQ